MCARKGSKTKLKARIEDEESSINASFEGFLIDSFAKHLQINSDIYGSKKYKAPHT